MLRAVTFDFWDTLFVDDSDEAIRAERGLASKVETRRRLVVQALRTQAGSLGEDLGEDEAGAAWDAANAWARARWKQDHHNPTVSARLMRAWRHLGLRPGAGFPELVDAIELMEADPAPVPVPGVHAVLDELSRGYRLGIISDAIVSPGRTLRRILADNALLHFFDYAIFSDEVGHSKPHPAVFEAAADGLGVGLKELAHVGDREENDVAGPQGVGAQAVLFTAVVDRGSANTRADLVCTSLPDLPEQLRVRNGAPPVS